MARIKKRKGRYSGGYERVFGNEELGHLISCIHSAVISSGRELEQLIGSKVEPIPDLDEFLKAEVMPNGVFLAVKKQIKDSKTLDFAGSEPDFVIFRRREGRQQCYVVELKDGDNFDTKKAAAEGTSIHDFVGQNAPLMGFKVSSHVCCFNQESKEAIVLGFKSKITYDEAMTGREFCELLEIDYESILEERKADQEPNLYHFIDDLLSIESVRKLIEVRLRSQKANAS